MMYTGTNLADTCVTVQKCSCKLNIDTQNVSTEEERRTSVQKTLQIKLVHCIHFQSPMRRVSTIMAQCLASKNKHPQIKSFLSAFHNTVWIISDFNIHSCTISSSDATFKIKPNHAACMNRYVFMQQHITRSLTFWSPFNTDYPFHVDWSGLCHEQKALL